MKKIRNMLGKYGFILFALCTLCACGASSSLEEMEEIAAESQQSTIMEESEIIVESSVEESTSVMEENEEETEKEDTLSEMQVHYIDVGQGDATLVTCGGEAMLIDAGDNTKGTTVQLYLKKQGIEKLKYLILTHPDADHIGGADVVVTKFDIENVFLSDYTKDNKTYEELTGALESKNLKGITPNVGNTYSLGSAEFTIIAPNTTYSDPNNSSIGLLLKNGENAFLFTGDAEEEAEYDILANGLSIDCDVYKAGHHGSNTASTEEFLEAASPEYVVISCAEDNSYGHPHAEPMNRFRSMGMKLFRTDEQGSIIAASDGTEITWNCAPTDSWKTGENTQSSSGSKDSSTAGAESQQENEPTAEQKQQSAAVSNSVASSNALAGQGTEQTQTQKPAIAETPAVVEQPAAEPNTGGLVWKSATGKKYHSINDCGNMNPNKATQITKAEAEALGLGPCSKCW